jgi:hypothetical protein
MAATAVDVYYNHEHYSGILYDSLYKSICERNSLGKEYKHGVDSDTSIPSSLNVTCANVVFAQCN